jgi:hypothetical protein
VITSDRRIEAGSLCDLLTGVRVVVPHGIARRIDLITEEGFGRCCVEVYGPE